MMGVKSVAQCMSPLEPELSPRSVGPGALSGDSVCLRAEEWVRASQEASETHVYLALPPASSLSLSSHSACLLLSFQI